MPSDIRFPSVFKPAIDPVLPIRLALQTSTGLCVGQTLEARVLERLDDGRFTVSVGESHLTAEAESSLRPGQTMTLRVDSLSPRVLLSVLSPPEERIITESLRGYRSDPGALIRSLVEIAEIFGGKPSVDLLRLAGGSNVAAVLDALESVIPGRGRNEETFSLHEAVRSLGLLIESDLKRAVENPEENLPVPSASLKSCLMRILEEFQAKLRSTRTESADGRSIRALAPAMEQAVRAIESLQVLNVQLQENGGKIFLQVPLSLHGIMGKADIFIQDEDWRHGKGGQKKFFRVVIALEMDALGDLIAQAHFRVKEATVRIYCEKEPVALFVSELLPELKKKLFTAGFPMTDLTVSAESSALEAIEDRIRKEMCGEGQTLNVFA